MKSHEFSSAIVPDWTVKTSQKGEGEGGMNRRKKLIGSESGHHLPKYAGLSSHVMLSEVWLSFRLSMKPREFAPGSERLGLTLFHCRK